MNAIMPIPRLLLNVRPATMNDVPFIDQLQKMHSHMVGWMPGKQIEGKIAAGHVIIAEDDAKTAIGYCISQDQYHGRDDVGVIYQLNVLPLRQRHLIGASLIKAVFERAAYGCRLFCLWCAQDIQANYFWESIGFVPLAFRTGSRSKQRIHIFWQRRIREGDVTTPYWFPSQTKSGAIREDRLVLPIPPGTHWRDAKPLVLPGMIVEPERPKILPGGAPIIPRPEQPRVSVAKKMAIMRSQSKHLKGLPPGKAAVVTSSGLRYIERGDYVPEVEPPKPKRIAKPRAKNDPKLIAAARELRDRWLEQVNNDPSLLLSRGKYEVSKPLALASSEFKPTALLGAA
jgi:GNAT superfamily N-acetyltransferase